MIGLLLVNLGTPASPKTGDVRRYLREFLSDPRVIDIHPIARWLLVNLIIAPFRAPKSAQAYAKIWTPQGSPLWLHTRDLSEAVAKKLGGGYAVEMAMRYGKPSIAEGIEQLAKQNVEEIRILPLYPQYASSSTGSTEAEVFRVEKTHRNLPPLRLLSPFFDHPGFIRAFAELGRSHLAKFDPDYVLFSFHGLPERQILKGDLSGAHCLKQPDCCDTILPANGLCYRAHCYQTAREIARELGLAAENFGVSFQSRLGRTPWIQPFTDVVLPQLVKAGRRRIAVYCPAFVADCLETLEEIGIRAKEMVWHEGGDLLLIPSLNSHPLWVEAVAQMAQGKNEGTP